MTGDTARPSGRSLGTLGRLSIRKAKRSDLDQILRIARSWRVGERSAQELSRQGFLVSDFDVTTYEHLLRDSEYGFVAVNDGQVVGFLMGYRGDQATQFGDYSAEFAGKDLEEFAVSKQVAVAPEWVGRGVASKLYRHLIRRLAPGITLIAAVVDDPPNERSREVHAALGFIEGWRIDHPDGRPRTVWRLDLPLS